MFLSKAPEHKSREDYSLDCWADCLSAMSVSPWQCAQGLHLVETRSGAFGFNCSVRKTFRFNQVQVLTNNGEKKRFLKNSIWFTNLQTTPEGKKSSFLQFLQYFGHSSSNFGRRDLKNTAYEPGQIGFMEQTVFCTFHFVKLMKYFVFRLKNMIFFKWRAPTFAYDRVQRRHRG